MKSEEQIRDMIRGLRKGNGSFSPGERLSHIQALTWVLGIMPKICDQIHEASIIDGDRDLARRLVDSMEQYDYDLIFQALKNA